MTISTEDIPKVLKMQWAKTNDAAVVFKLFSELIKSILSWDSTMHSILLSKATMRDMTQDCPKKMKSIDPDGARFPAVSNRKVRNEIVA